MRCDNRVRNYKMGYSATCPMGVVCRKKWGSEGVGGDSEEVIIQKGLYCKFKEDL